MAVVRKIQCEVRRITAHGSQVYTIDLVPEAKVPAFKPGQFLHLALDEYDPSGFWPDSRVFSIASSPDNRDVLSLTFSVKGRFTARMEHDLAEGRKVWIKLPYGDFLIEGHRDVALFAGGTGITAFTGFLAGLTDGYPNRLYLFYGAKHTSLLVYHDLVEKVTKQIPQFIVHYFVETPDNPCRLMEGNKTCLGKLSVAQVWDQILDPFKITYYLSGPPLMLTTLSQELQDRGIPSGAIRIDSWD